MIVISEDEVIPEDDPCLVGWFLFTPYLAIAVEEVGVLDVLITPTGELRVIDNFVASGSFLAFLQLFK